MIRNACRLSLMCLSLLTFAESLTDLTAEEFTFGAKTLRVPDGYLVEQVTTPELVQRPIAVARDEQGRLYVTDSGGMSERAEKQLELKPHSIRRLEDTDHDGVYDRSTLFADRMMFPEGCLWFQGSLYVAAPPEIWKLTDADDDGVAEQREVWFDGKTLTGCGNDLHGPYAGMDGRLYWCKGAFAEQSYTLPGGQPFTTRSSHIFRARPDGSEIEPVLTGGMDNPVNVAFLPNGERFLSCTFFQFPEAGRRDGLIHAIYGGVYGKKHDSIYSHAMTGDVMPVLSHQGAAAPCGLLAGSSQLFAENNDQRLYACYFNLHKVVRHQLLATGPTYTTLDEDFISCDHPDFHPTDVFEDADGSLLMVDTGGWYKVCCPTSQLAKPDVLGAVYRIRRRDQPTIDDPLGEQLGWDELSVPQLVERLADPRLFVQRRAISVLRQRGAPAIPHLAAVVHSHDDADVRLRAIWTLAGIEHVDSGLALVPALSDPASTNRQAAAHAVGLQRVSSGLPELVKMVLHDEPGPARAAAEALGRLRDPRAVPQLLKALAVPLPAVVPPVAEGTLLPAERVQQAATETPPADAAVAVRGPAAWDDSGAPAASPARVREHAVIYALIEIGHPDATRAGLTAASEQVRRGTLVALDQMPGDHLQADEVIAVMSSEDAALRHTAMWIVEQHADWGQPLASYFATQLARAEHVTDATVDVLAGLAKAPEIQELVATLLNSSRADLQSAALEVIGHSQLSAPPRSWLDGLTERLKTAPREQVADLVSAARHLPQLKGGHAALTRALQAVADRPELERPVRLEALAAAGSGQQASDQVFQLLTACLRSDQEMSLRTTAAQLLGTSLLTADQRQTLLGLVPEVGPLELPQLLPALEAQTDEDFGLQLVSALAESEGRAGLRTDLLKPLLEKYPPTVRTAGQPLLTSLNASAEQQASELETMLQSLPPGDINRGHEVFMGKKAACITCHKLGYGGGRLGPDLSTIGRIRTRRDLLEAVMFPSVSIVRGYEPVVVELSDGRTQSGIVISESRDEVVLGIDAVKTSHIARSEVEAIFPSNISPMPNGMIKLLTPEELADLIEFLLSRK